MPISTNINEDDNESILNFLFNDVKELQEILITFQDKYDVLGLTQTEPGVYEIFLVKKSK